MTSAEAAGPSTHAGASGGGVAVEAAGGRRTLRLDRADKMNALSPALVAGLASALEAAIEAQAALVVVEGIGRNFSAGFDFGDLPSLGDHDLLARFIAVETMLQAFARAPMPTLAFAHGRNFGAGVDLFATCRQRVAAPDATFRMPGLAFGLQLGTRRFARIVGADRAAAILGGLETFDAERALAIGFVHRIAGRDEWPAIADEAAARASALPARERAVLARAIDFAEHDGDHDRDLADLVRSAARPGLKSRIEAYLSARTR